MRFGRTASYLAGRFLTALGVVAAAIVVVAPTPASAHTPHDDIVDIATSPRYEDDAVVYAISRRYLLKSADGGDSWQRLQRGLTLRHNPSSVTVAETDPNIVYVTSRGDGMYRSDDAGREWHDVSGDIGDRNLLFAEISPRSPDTVVAAAAGVNGSTWITRTGGTHWSSLNDIPLPRAVAFADDDPSVIVIGNEAGHVHVSADAGHHWSTTALPKEVGSVRAVVISPSFSADRTFWVGTASGGVFISTDGGRSFSPASDGLDDQSIMDLHLTGVDGPHPMLWASTVNAGVSVSTDDGRTWQPRSDGLTTDEMADRIGVPNFGSFSAGGNTAEPTMFLASFDGLFRLAPRGESWDYLVTQTSSNATGIDVSPSYANDHTVAVATYINGALLSRDNGKTWDPIDNGLATSFEWTRRADYVARLTGIAFYPTYADDQIMFVGERGYFLESRNSGRRWIPHLPDGILVEGEFPADYYVPAFSPAFAEDHTIMLGTDGGKIFRYTGDATDIELVGNTGVEITALVASSGFPEDQTLLAGTRKGLLKTTDGGKSWFESGSVKREITSLTASDDFANDGIAFAGTPSGLFRTVDGGGQWAQVTSDAFGPRPIIEAVVVSPDFATDGTLLVSISGLGLFRSTDGGQTFEPVGRELIENQVVLKSFYHPTTEPIVFSPTFAEDRTVFGIAEDHVYRSEDAGDTWETLDLPVVRHDPTVPPNSPLLTSPRFGMDTNNLAAPPTRSDRGFDTPIGALSARRVAAAVLLGIMAFLVCSLPLRRRASAGKVSAPSQRTALVVDVRTRAALSFSVIVIGLLLLAA